MIKDISRSALNLLMGLILAGFTFSGKAVAADDGKAIFKQNCAVCHSMCDQHLTGPGLKGVGDRVPKGEWLFNWIKNNERLIKSGDAYAQKILKDNGGASMTVFEGTLTDDQIKAVEAYIIKGDCQATSTATSTSTSTGGGEVAKGPEAGIDPLYIILAIIVILAILIGILRGIRNSLSVVAEHTPEEELSKTFWQESREWMAGHRRFIGVCCLIILAIGMKSCWNACFDIGVYYDWETQKGYKPEQPIKFSHKLHAGDNGIACQYCHNSVEKSRHAGIPTVNVCMNCHKSIQTGPQYGDKEISKIYAAAGFNTKTGQYDPTMPQNPIKWIKVHNLPDHVYFNHSQHVVVGKQECSTCHGNLKEMTVAEQGVPLTMKWCIECHRKTDVAMEGNAYYDKLHAYLKEKYKDQHLKTFTVAQMGGLECGKCHY